MNSEVVAGGSSDHLAIITTKLSRETISRPPQVKKRSYKYFSKENFLLEIRNTDFKEILSIYDSDEAANMFGKIFGQILDNHAPVKIFQTRYNYAPWLSDKTKNDIKIRNGLKYQSTISNDPEILHKYKCLRNSIKARLKNEEETYYKDKFKESKSNVKNLWKCAYEILGQFNDFSPSQLNYNGTVIKSPDKLAEIFNDLKHISHFHGGNQRPRETFEESEEDKEDTESKVTRLNYNNSKFYIFCQAHLDLAAANNQSGLLIQP